jgi:hypothetical protein
MRKLVLGVGGMAVLVAAIVVYANYGPWFAFREKRALISNMLKDPASTQFRNEFMSGSGWLCGELNSKNSEGGYVGFKKFAVRSDKEIYLQGEGSLNEATTEEVIETVSETTAMLKNYIELKKETPSLQIPSDRDQYEAAKRRVYEKKLEAACTKAV